MCSRPRVFDLTPFNSRRRIELQALLAYLPAQTPLLALDVGLRHIGLAVSDPNRVLARPVQGFQRGISSNDVKYLLRASSSATAVVVGIPALYAAHGTVALLARAYGTAVAAHAGLAVILAEEAFTTYDAVAAVHAVVPHAQRRTRTRKKRAIDSVCCFRPTSRVITIPVCNAY